jgi:fructose-1,6-bisphosphatase
MPAQLHKGEAVIPAKFNSDEYVKRDQALQSQSITVYQTINLDGKEIGQNVEQYLLNRASNMGTGIYNNSNA